jgi:FAD-linked sulfhydryl oxidase
MQDLFAGLKDKFSKEERCSEPSCTEGKTTASKLVYPPDRSEMGRAAWKYIHTRAEHYDPANQAQEMAWLEAFVALYPCKLCARDFAAICHRLPPRLENRNIYMQWWIDAHNEVNRDLSKPIFK